MSSIKKSILYVLTFALLGGLLTGVFLVSKTPEDGEYVSTPVLEKIVPVASTNSNIIKPFVDEDITILKNYYDWRNKESQPDSLIFYDNTYMQNTGVIYGKNDPFNIVSIADGEVIKVEDNELSGKTVEIRYSNDVIGVYHFVSDVNVKVNDTIKQGTLIGKSSISNLVDNTKNQLYFELIVKGELVNPENYYGKNINEI
mgnify:CR=1 FL=1